jgi:hypothetical protein
MRWCLVLCLLSFGCSKHSRQMAEPDASVPLTDHSAGKGCKRDADCPGGRCASELHIASASQASAAMGGYCTRACDSDSQCGERGECSVPAGEEAGECLGNCKREADCRDGYTCVGAGGVSGISISGTCQPMARAGNLRGAVVGDACGSDGDCPGGECLRTTPLGMKFPNNYCSARCFEDAQCGDGGACLVFAGSGDAGHCYAHCSSDADCTREDYRCRRLGSDLMACYPAPAPLPNNTAGNPCTSDQDCGGAMGSCATTLPLGIMFADQVAPAPGGYCTQPCSLDSECGDGAQCISAGVTGGLCMSRCSAEADCREGYACLLTVRDLNDDHVCRLVPK